MGPTLGALLFDAGGFALPFELCGTLCLVTGKVTNLQIRTNFPKKTLERICYLKIFTESSIVMLLSVASYPRTFRS